MKMKNLFKTLPFMAIAAGCLTGCNGTKYDATLVIYNWEDYIYEGTDEDGNIIEDDPGVCALFEEYYKEKTGLNIHVDYECFSTNEIMYQQIELGSIQPDLICPSDYMIQKMANEGKLEKFSYDENEKKFGESLSNWDNYGSPYIKDRFANEKLNDGSSFLSYSVPYFWGTMGFTYDMDYFTESEISTWEALWNTDSKYNKKFTLKDSMRDSYVPAIFHVYKDEIAALDKNASNYSEQLAAIFNRCDDVTLSKVETALKSAKGNNVYGFEVDDGKDEIIKGTYKANLAWSGDSVYSMDEAEKAGKTLGYALPKEGSNIWFDGWCMPKGANKELAEEFINFICKPSVAAKCMDSVGYTSPVAGQEIWELVNDWYAADEEELEENVDVCDLSYYFGDTVEGEATIRILKSERGRQFDAQYPSLEQISKCAIMKDFGTQTPAVNTMWANVKSK